MKNCPQCDRDITDSHEQAEPDVGIEQGGWYCSACDLFVADEGDEFDQDMEISK